MTRRFREIVVMTGQEAFEDYVSTLNCGGSHRVWSLIVSFFGDLAQGEGDRVSGAVLTRIGQMAGITPEALRVALHRLKRDGWIDSERNGRRSVYFLTRRGRDESAAASPRIYGDAVSDPGLWTVLIGEPGAGPVDIPASGSDAQGCIFVGDDVAIVGGRIADPDDSFAILFGSDIVLPQWLRRQLTGPDLDEAAEGLYHTLTQLGEFGPAASSFSALENATLRTLLVHSWRRVRLRQPDLPDGFFAKSWKGPLCRSRFQSLLENLPKPDLQALEAEVAGMSQQ